MSRRARQLLAIALLAGLTACVEKKEPIFVTSIGPNLPSFLTLPSGHTYTLLQTGPLVGKEGKVLGWRIAFLSPESDPGVLEANAKELLEFARTDPQAAGFPAVIVFAVLSFDPETRRDMHYGIVFELKPTGWEQSSRVENVPDSSPEIPKLLDGWGGFTRDSRAAASGVKAAADWLQLIDGGQIDKAWEQASPLLRAVVPRATWEAQSRAMLRRPKVSSRVEASRLYTGYAMNFPPAKYLAVCFKTRRAGSDETMLERVELRLEEDGVWRVIGVRTT